MSRLTRYDLSPIAIEISISSLKQRRPIKEYESLERSLNKSTIHAYTVVRKIKPKFCIVRGFVGTFDHPSNEKYRHLRNIQTKRTNLSLSPRPRGIWQKFVLSFLCSNFFSLESSPIIFTSCDLIASNKYEATKRYILSEQNRTNASWYVHISVRILNTCAMVKYNLEAGLDESFRFALSTHPRKVEAFKYMYVHRTNSQRTIRTRLSHSFQSADPRFFEIISQRSRVKRLFVCKER